jgi:hypothetical protein
MLCVAWCSALLASFRGALVVMGVPADTAEPAVVVTNSAWVRSTRDKNGKRTLHSRKTTQLRGTQARGISGFTAQPTNTTNIATLTCGCSLPSADGLRQVRGGGAGREVERIPAIRSLHTQLRARCDVKRLLRGVGVLIVVGVQLAPCLHRIRLDDPVLVRILLARCWSSICVVRYGQTPL